MVRNDVHPVPQVEAVRAEALDTGVEMKLVTALRPGLRDQPVEQHSAVSARALVFGGDEIVHVKHFAPRQEFSDAEAGDTGLVPILWATAERMRPGFS